MDKVISSSIYIIYIIIASISVIISYKISIVMSLIVVAIEYVRLIAIYKQKYSVILLIFIMNLALIGYNSYKSQSIVEQNNAQIVKTNEAISKYISTKDLKAVTMQKLKEEIKEIKTVAIDWWLLVVVYVILELSLLLLLLGMKGEGNIKKEARQSAKVNTGGSKITSNATINNAITSNAVTNNKTINKEACNNVALENIKGGCFVGSYLEYARNNNIAVRRAKALFSNWESEGRLVKVEGKNYLKGDSDATETNS